MTNSRLQIVGQWMLCTATTVCLFFCTYSIFSAKISPILLPMTTLFIIKHWQFDEVWFDLTNICEISETNSRTAVLFWSNLPLCEFWGLHCFFVCWHNPLFVPTKIHQYSPGATTTSCAPIKQVKFVHAQQLSGAIKNKWDKHFTMSFRESVMLSRKKKRQRWLASEKQESQKQRRGE